MFRKTLFLLTFSMVLFGVFFVSRFAYSVCPAPPGSGNRGNPYEEQTPNECRLSPADVVITLCPCFVPCAGNPPPQHPCACDLNCDGMTTGADIVLELNYVFLGQPPSPGQAPNCPPYPPLPDLLQCP